MASDLRALRREVIRQVRSAANTLALVDARLPPEGPFDAALANGLVVIVSSEWSRREKGGAGDHLQPARALLGIIEANVGMPLPYVDVDRLKEGLELTQPFRHGRVHDEFATIRPQHVAALGALDQHPGLRILDKVCGRSVDDALWLAFAERTEGHLLSTSGTASACPSRAVRGVRPPTFLPRVDWFGGISSLGACIACGYERSESEAWDNGLPRPSDALLGLGLPTRVGSGTNPAVAPSPTPTTGLPPPLPDASRAAARRRCAPLLAGAAPLP